jgi:hypothetical protein
MRGLAYRKLWNPERQFSYLDGFLLAATKKGHPHGPMAADQHKQIGIL